MECDETIKKRYAVINMRTGDVIWCDDEHIAKMHLAKKVQATERWLKECVDNEKIDLLRNFLLAKKLKPHAHDFEVLDYYNPDKRYFWNGLPCKVNEGCVALAPDDSDYLDGFTAYAEDVIGYQDTYAYRNVAKWLYERGDITLRECVAIECYLGNIDFVPDDVK